MLLQPESAKVPGQVVLVAHAVLLPPFCGGSRRVRLVIQRLLAALLAHCDRAQSLLHIGPQVLVAHIFRVKGFLECLASSSVNVTFLLSLRAVVRYDTLRPKNHGTDLLLHGSCAQLTEAMGHVVVDAT